MAKVDQINVAPLGFVRLVDSMGDDASIVQAARVSYGPGTTTKRKDVKLLRYLHDNKHMSPFEQVSLKFHIKMPIFIARQMVRHRTAKINEVSARYSQMKPEFWFPCSRDDIRSQDTKNKQGSKGTQEIPDELCSRWFSSSLEAHNLYTDLLEAGVAREQARAVLPVSLYTEWYWKIDLRNLLHFLKLRLHPHAQTEMQEYARAIAILAEKVAPETINIAFPDSTRGVYKA